MFTNPQGFTLRYAGKKFDPRKKAQTDQTESGIESLRTNFSNLGALVMRFQLGQAQFAALIQQMTEKNYPANSIEAVAKGGNEIDLFSIEKDDGKEVITTKALEEYSHYPIGRGKILNEKGQSQLYPNTEGLHGGQSIWDNMHFAVWSAGLNLAFQLRKQGFIYIRHPDGTNENDYAKITRELEQSQFTIMMENGEPIIKTSSNVILKTGPIPSNTEIDLDPDLQKTYQSNGFVISTNDHKAPLGWFLKLDQKKIIDPVFTENLIRIIRISKTGFHRLTSAQQHLLELDLLSSNGYTVHTQNRTFNAMNVILDKLEKEYGFHSSELLNDETLKRLYKKIKEDEKNKDIVEDLLTLNLVTEMVQSLKLTGPRSPRPPLPWNFKNSFRVTENTNKAFAYAFDLEKKDGTPVLKMHENERELIEDKSLIDISINGDLANPDLTNPKHAAALLATAILVAEQMLIEQLLRDACMYGDAHDYAKALKKIINNNSVYADLIKLAKKMPQNKLGPILGLQFNYCDPIVALIRKELSHDTLADLANYLYQGSSKTKYLNHNIVSAALEKLSDLGGILQQLDGISGQTIHSRGINAGLALVIDKMPKLLGRLNEEIKTAQEIKPTNDSDIGEITSTRMGKCPYLNSIHSHLLPQNVERESQHPTSVPSSNWCGWFSKLSNPAKAVVPVLIAGAVYTMNNYMKK